MKILFESIKNEPSVYMNTWANYNEYGADGVLTPAKWMSIEDAIEYCEEYAEYEPFINDTDNIPDVFEISEYSSVKDLKQLQELIDSDTDLDVVCAIMECGYKLPEAIEKAENHEYTIIYDVDDNRSLGIRYIEDLYGGDLSNIDIENYIDESAMYRDYKYDAQDYIESCAEDEWNDLSEEEQEELDKDDFIEDYVNERLDDFINISIQEDIEEAEAGHLDLSAYFDYEAFGRTLAFDFTFVTINGESCAIDVD